MKVSDFDYNLPARLIAERPPEQRGRARLLVLDRASGGLADKAYGDLADLLRAGDVLVLNNTKVIKARLWARKASGATRELIILEKHSGDRDWHRHKVLYRGRLAVGDLLKIDTHQLIVEEILGGGVAVISSSVDLLKLAEKYGAPPLPPYIKRTADARDVERYQTVFAQSVGSAAAPTASLNMTDDLLNILSKKGVIIKYLTLHVGLGTFLPIREEQLENHPIHSEYFEIPSSTIQAITEAKAQNRRIVAVGTTVARTLEYAMPKNLTSGEADIFIYPSYKFQVINALLTNFHAPRSSVLMLAAAFAGTENLKTAYQHAIDQKYRFLSYGDSMFIM